MDTLDAIILGIVQGLAEYLPISSSGHLEIANQILGLNTSGADSLQFDVLLHVATVLSTIVVLWHEFSGICRSFFTWKRDDNFYTLMKIFVSCIPVLVVGVFFKDTVEQAYGGNLIIIGTCLCITALLLGFAYFTRTRTAGSATLTPAGKGRDIGYFDAFVIGCAQAVAVLPGLSRSGSTIATGILLGNKRDRVAHFSFLMVIIPVLGAACLDILKAFMGKEPMADISMSACIGGFLASFIVGCLACKWMIDIVNKGGLIWFAIYCIIVGVVCVIFA